MDINLKTNNYKYISIYEEIVERINTGILKPNEKLLSKRDMAINLNVSLNTIINAYNLLLDEGYIYSIEKKGYYVTNQPVYAYHPQIKETIKQESKNIKFDFTTRSVDNIVNPRFKKIYKSCIENDNYTEKTNFKGDIKLRKAIKKHLFENRGINVSLESIIISSGMEIFKEILSCISLDKIYLENPGYHKLAAIAKNIDKKIEYIDLDLDGVKVPSKSGILYTTSFNQFPTGIKMSISRKKELLSWAINSNSIIIEDDFDAEFRINSMPTTALYSLNNSHVIFFSTFSTTIYPGLRISYAILPDDIMKKYENKYSSYSCSVPTLDQLVLCDFINSGEYVRHINKTKKRYLEKREKIINELKKIDNININTKKNYLSILVELPNLDKTELINNGILINSLSDYDYYSNHSDTFILGYTGIKLEDIKDGIKAINNILKNKNHINQSI